MTLSARVLPPEEWDRLLTLEPFTSQGLPASGEWIVVVVERDGAIVGTCSLFTAVHWDCWWIVPELRGTTAVLRQLLDLTLAVLAEAEIQTVYTGVGEGDADVAALLTHFGFTPAPGRLFVLDVAPVLARLKEA